MKTLSRAIAIALLPACAGSYAATERDLEAHSHGVATLDVVLEGGGLELMLESPWANLVGFEHAPGNAEQQAAVDDALAALETDPTLFMLPEDAGCRLDVAEATSEMGEHGHGDEHGDEHDDEHGDEHDDEHDDEHGDEHDDEHGDEHGDEHDDEHDDEYGDEHDDEQASEHSDVVASWRYACDDAGELDEIDVGLMARWSGIETLAVRMVGPGGQSATTLDADDARIDLGAIR